MTKKPVASLTVLVSICALLSMLGASPAFAAPNAHGTVTCSSMAGSGSVSPGLTPLGSIGGVKIKFKANFKKCAGHVNTPGGVVIKAGSLVGSGYYVAVPGFPRGSSCTNFRNHDKVGVIKVTINWITQSGGPIAPTLVTYSADLNTVTGAVVDTITLRTSGVKSGSFAFPPAGLPKTVKIKTTLPASPPPCGAGPFRNFNITAGMVSM